MSKKQNLLRVAVRLPVGLHHWLKMRAARIGKSMAAQVREALEQYRA